MYRLRTDGDRARAIRPPFRYIKRMATLTYRTAGESHGPALISLIEGLPAGLRLDMDLINGELRRRQGGVWPRGPAKN